MLVISSITISYILHKIFVRKFICKEIFKEKDIELCKENTNIHFDKLVQYKKIEM